MLLVYLSLAENQDDKNKIEQLYMLYKNQMLNKAYDILGSSQGAEDATHEAFLRIIKNLDKIGDIDSSYTKSYMIVVVKNVAINMYNKAKKVIAVPDEELERVSYDNVQVQVEAEIGAEVLAAKIAQLPELYRQILMLKYLNHMTDKEIALSLGIRNSTVRKRVERARDMLRKMIERGLAYD